MKWIVTKHLIGKNFKIIRTEVMEFDYKDHNQAYAQKKIWEKEANTEVYIALV